MGKKLTSVQKIKRALAQLDTAVQEWYAENNPTSQVHYASPCIMDLEEIGHVSRITLDKGPGEINNWVTLTTKRHWEEGAIQ